MNQDLLSKIKSPQDLKDLSAKDIPLLAAEIRKTILQVVSSNGGHLASNLGVVELTIALHRVFSSPEDSILWDVGHQCYTHKLLTRRYERFHTLRLKDGISGFPKREESIHDAFNTGHSSTSISVAEGILAGNRLQGKRGKVIAVIGDGALTGGMAFEALSNACQEKDSDLIIILNDNKMSISKNTGAISEYLSRLTMRAGYQRLKYLANKGLNAIPYVGPKLRDMLWRLKHGAKGFFYRNNIFVDFGFEYVGPLNGHNERELEKVLLNVKKLNHPAVVHVQTVKGKGHPLAEHNPCAFHSVGPVVLAEGTIEKNETITFTEAFSRAILAEAKNDERIVAITAAMSDGTGLAPFARLYPQRFFDVGIAEQHAVTFAAGLTVTGLRPIVAIYSTFLQRAIDQIIHDTAIQNLPVIFAIDRAGAVPDDGETHQGIFDLSILRTIPNMNILAPASAQELALMLHWALAQDTPIAIRYPKTRCAIEQDAFSLPVQTGKGVLIRHNDKSKILFVCTGGIFSEVQTASNMLAHKGIFSDMYNLRFVKPVDKEYFLSIAKNYSIVIFIEDGAKIGSISFELQTELQTSYANIKTALLAFEDMFYPHGARLDILMAAGLSPNHIAEKAEELIMQTIKIL
ncbi:1-deoxy-D-xylulose-5-phosphate synthase [Treponema phagedenis]|uniref:1-deoxy-D-xylulose-5-phosphate synthase n=1 Tax=Treponema phagedenis TaxID=162 RepID=A0A0B7GZ96_TREPH|nr:1-deoxy-D-xylulose-5-phosphate synthase [Treponema phagedenis]QSH98599.1 1-deoxy-D-xylulose-5-phosphate synthase [Treponema phagedenis]CEM61981.1 1-deoxy-D-xylulose-5-phosphate synthase [Treponema phagedenis]